VRWHRVPELRGLLRQLNGVYHLPRSLAV
jgi:hypothetical protein